jgi:peptidoglycan/LPS O-acetylase OafA/YrhL
MRQRDQTIDLLRGLSILQVIYMHVTPYFGSLPLAAWITNWGQAVVPLLLYCSMAVSKPIASLTWSTYIGVVIKRMRRLLLPYYFFLVLYIVLTWSLGKTMSLRDFISNVILTGGINFNWLVLLFVGIGLMLPVFQYLHASRRNVWFVFFVLSMACSVWALFNRASISSSYRMWMLLLWIPFIQMFQTVEVLRRHNRRNILTLVLLLVVGFAVIYVSLIGSVASVHMSSHKYPPDIYYYVFSSAAVALIVYLAPYIVSLIPQLAIRYISYCSRVSYELYFAHILVLTWLDVSFPRRDIAPGLFTMLVFGGSFVLVWVGAQITAYIRSKHHE